MNLMHKFTLHNQHPSPHLYFISYTCPIGGVFPAGKVLGGAGGIHQAAAFRAQGDADGGGDRGGVCALLAAVLYHQHGQSGRHHPRVQRHSWHLLLCRRPVLRQLLCQPGALWLPVGQPETELQKSRGV